jgi:hypothetical protein
MRVLFVDDEQEMLDGTQGEIHFGQVAEGERNVEEPADLL